MGDDARAYGTGRMTVKKALVELRCIRAKWKQEARAADVEGSRLWLNGVVFGLSLAIEYLKKPRAK
jgi:hypothetical protein